MKRIAIALLLLALAACGGSEWRPLEVPDGAFAALMRGQPHYARQTLDTPAGQMQAHLYSSDRPDAYYAIGFSDYPLTFAIQTQAEEILNGVRDTWVKRINGKLVTSGREAHDKNPGLQFTARGTFRDRDVLLDARLYLVDQRLYQLVAITRTAETPQGVVNRFFKSFRLAPPGAVGELKFDAPNK